jgi:hypothetical protein
MQHDWCVSYSSLTVLANCTFTNRVYVGGCQHRRLWSSHIPSQTPSHLLLPTPCTALDLLRSCSPFQPPPPLSCRLLCPSTLSCGRRARRLA